MINKHFIATSSWSYKVFILENTRSYGNQNINFSLNCRQAVKIGLSWIEPNNSTIQAFRKETNNIALIIKVSHNHVLINTKRHFIYETLPARCNLDTVNIITVPKVRFNDSWFVFQDSSWSFSEPYFTIKHIFHKSFRVIRTHDHDLKACK